MSIRITNIQLGLEEPEENLADHCRRILGLPGAIPNWRILRKSLDARDRDSLRFTFTVLVALPEDEERIVALSQARARPDQRVEILELTPFIMPRPGVRLLDHPPVVIGAGPAGMVAAYFLAQQGYRPLVLERGRPVNDRIHDVHAFDTGAPLNPESNYLFGEGGAGTFSDGKLTCRASGPDVQRVLELFAECKGKPSLVYESRPHLGSNRLPAVVKAIRQRILALGGDIRFSCRVEDLEWGDGRLRGLGTSSGPIPASVVVLAIGHSARDTYQMLARRGIPMARKPFQMGIRIEQPQETVNRVQYGPTPWEDKLGSADYTLVVRGPNDLFTFCMCAGGHIIPSVSAEGYFCTNGMSLSKRSSPFANSGLMITMPVDQFGGPDALAGVRLQEMYERTGFDLGRGNYDCPMQRATDYLVRKRSRTLLPCSYPRGVVSADLAGLMPPLIREALDYGLPALDKRWQGRFLASAMLAGPESRGSSPIRILRDASGRATPGVEGLYPVGEGAGYAGGIISAAVDGLRSAKAIVEKYAPLESRPS